MKRGKNGRVGFEPGAVRQYTEELERIGARRGRNDKSKKRKTMAC